MTSTKLKMRHRMVPASTARRSVLMSLRQGWVGVGGAGRSSSEQAAGGEGMPQQRQVNRCARQEAGSRGREWAGDDEVEGWGLGLETALRKQHRNGPSNGCRCGCPIKQQHAP